MYLLFPKGMRVGVFINPRDTVRPTVCICNLMTQNKNQNILYTQTLIIYMVMLCLNFFPTDEFKWIDSKEFDLNKYTSNSLKGCEVDVEYTK